MHGNEAGILHEHGMQRLHSNEAGKDTCMGARPERKYGDGTGENGIGTR